MVIPMDCYYHGLDRLDIKARRSCNFDDPALLDWGLLLAHMKSLSSGHAIQRPVYSFELYSRLAEAVTIQPSSFIIIEGIFALYSKDLRAVLSTKVYVTAPDDICFSRRLERDTRDRGRSPEFVIEQYEATVRPSLRKFIMPTMAEADLILSGDQPFEDSLLAALGIIEMAVR
jgi:uridine kinase